MGTTAGSAISRGASRAAQPRRWPPAQIGQRNIGELAREHPTSEEKERCFASAVDRSWTTRAKNRSRRSVAGSIGAIGATENPIAILGGNTDVVAVCPAKKFGIEHAAETMQVRGKLKPLGRNRSERPEVWSGLRSRMGES